MMLLRVFCAVVLTFVFMGVIGGLLYLINGRQK